MTKCHAFFLGVSLVRERFTTNPGAIRESEPGNRRSLVFKLLRAPSGRIRIPGLAISHISFPTPNPPHLQILQILLLVLPRTHFGRIYPGRTPEMPWAADSLPVLWLGYWSAKSM